MKKHTKSAGISPKLIAVPKHRRKFAPRPMRQVGSYIVLFTGVSRKIARLVHTEAAIHNKSVSGMLNDILANRYAKVK